MKEKALHSLPHSMEAALLNDIEKRECLDKNIFYVAKRSTIKHAQQMGLSDSHIQVMLDITISPEDKSCFKT